MRHRPCCLRRGDAVVSSCIPCPLERARGTPSARCTHGPGADAVFGKGNAPGNFRIHRGITRRSARDEAPACFVLFPAEWSTPGTEDAARRPVGVANSPIRDAPFGIEKPHDLGRRDSVVRQRFDRWFTALVGAAQPPTSAPDAVASPHPAPRIVTIASRPSQWSGTIRIIVLLGILSSDTIRRPEKTWACGRRLGITPDGGYGSPRSRGLLAEAMSRKFGFVV